VIDTIVGSLISHSIELITALAGETVAFNKVDSLSLILLVPVMPTVVTGTDTTEIIAYVETVGSLSKLAMTVAIPTLSPLTSPVESTDRIAVLAGLVDQTMYLSVAL
jgi:hypothetical protein